MEQRVREAYDGHAVQYCAARKELSNRMLYNDLIEAPAMLAAVSDVEDIEEKSILDIGCGAGAMVKEYAAIGAKAYGVDLSAAMLQQARRGFRKGRFTQGSMMNLPFPDEAFDVATASFVVQHVEDLAVALREVERVLKPGGMLFYSDHSPLAAARTRYDDGKISCFGIGHVRDKATGALTVLGRYWFEGVDEVELLDGMTIPVQRRSFRSHLHAMNRVGLRLWDVLDCSPVPELETIDADAYKILASYPPVCIYVCSKSFPS
jgi:SAM-dependent methyltransferase